MNEEEAIEMHKELKKYKEIIGNIEPNFNTNLENWTITINLDYYNCLEEYIRRILDELEQKDKEINKTEQDRHKKTEKSLKGQLEKKEKMIDEMATYIATLDIEEDICEKTKNEHCDKMNFGECEDCIKQYFERKVEEN